MKYALGNMLNGAGGLNADGLSLDLQFATDKTLTARKGPTPVFTRGSGATFVDSGGLVRFAAENLVFQSEDFSTTWARTGIKAFGSGSIINTTLTTDPFGLNNADLIQGPDIAAPAYLSQNFTSVSLPTQLTASVYLKAGTSNWAIIEAFGAFCYYNLSGAGSTGSTSGSPTVSITALPDGWYRCTLSRESSASSIRIYVAEANSILNTTKNLFVYGCQVERSSTARAYIPTTTAAVYGPRFDHDPITLACRGLLIEESRTNLILQSENLGTTWALTNATASLNVATAPDGSTNADKIISTSGGALGRAQQSFSLSGSHVYSVFAKAAEWGFVYIAPLQANGGVWFDLTNGTVGAQQAGFVGSITPLGNGWYRCSVQFTGLGTLLTARIHPTNVDNVLTVGDGTSGILLWGAQLEAGSFPTSYIPTTTASLVRSADVCSITGGDFTGFYNQSEGTMLVNSFTPASGDRTIVAADDNTANEMIRLRTEGTNPFFKITDGGSELVAIDSGTVAANTAFKLAGAYKLNDFASSINGGAAVTDATGTVPTVDRMRIGAGQSGNTMCGSVSSLRYYKKRLSNAKLQTITV